MDWGLGEYERTAAQLAPVAQVAVEAADVGAGDRLLDVACGTGNAALEGALRGARVAGLDAAERLVGVARERVPDGEFVHGAATELPWPDDSFEAAVSVFGVMFAPDSPRVASELCRVGKPRGRVVITSWLPEGVIAAAAKAAFGDTARPDDGRIDWGDAAAIRDLFASRRVEIAELDAVFTAPSAAAVVGEWLDHHPVWLAAAADVRPKRRAMIDALEAGNEDHATFRAPSPYLLTTVTV